MIYRMASGASGEIDRLSNLMFNATDGRATCGEIDRKISPKTRASDPPSARQERWINLADEGLILLQPPGENRTGIAP
jgi:hypothetical protein